MAWLKVFNAYQNEVDFTNVIQKCYEVLTKMPYYSKGQAADWITSSGGQAGGKSRGMGNDGIRTPWRIAMDALWFNDSRAIAYCKNIKKTLTQYATDARGQMGLYDSNGNLINNTVGSFDFVAMFHQVLQHLVDRVLVE